MAWYGMLTYSMVMVRYGMTWFVMDVEARYGMVWMEKPCVNRKSCGQ